MYKVYCGDKLIHDTNISALQIHNAVVDLEIGKTGRFEFLMYEDHPYYSEIVLMTAMIHVYRDEENIFSGRVLRIEYGMYNEKKVTCEGGLAFLLDTLIEPDAYYGNFFGYLERLITIHNDQVEESKRFTIGKVSFDDFEGYEYVSEEYATILEAINASIIATTGGYLFTRYENGVRYLDVLSYNKDAVLSNQSITLGKNLIDLQRYSDGDDLFSAILPLGKEIDGARVNIGSVNSWNSYLTNAEALALYGYICKPVIFEDITDPQKLKNAGIAYLAENFTAVSNIEITVTDISPLDASLDAFALGQLVEVKSPKHFTETLTFRIIKMTVDITDPTKTRITVGKTMQGFVESVGSVAQSTGGTSIQPPDLTNGEIPAGAIHLPSGANLNDYTHAGFYVIPSSTISTTILNKPFTTNATGSLTVLQGGDGGQIIQICHVASKADGRIWQRAYYQGGWGEWSSLYNGAGKILWSGAYYMTSTHTATLSEKVSQQATGIVLVFSRYSNSVVNDYYFNSFFIPKAFVKTHEGAGSNFLMTADGLFGIMCAKYLYIRDDKITGNDVNDKSGAGTSGITYNNAGFVLRYVIGV